MTAVTSGETERGLHIINNIADGKSCSQFKNINDLIMINLEGLDYGFLSHYSPEKSKLSAYNSFKIQR